MIKQNKVSKEYHMGAKEIVIGHFNMINPDLPAEGELSLRTNPIDMMTVWKRCGLLSNFVGEYYAYTTQKENYDNVRNMVSTVFNEFIENAAKFSLKRNTNIDVNVKLYDIILKIEIENIADKSQAPLLVNNLQKILETNDVATLYFDKLARKEEGNTESGIGLLMLLKDYPVKLGLRVVNENDSCKVTVQAYCQIEED